MGEASIMGMSPLAFIGVCIIIFCVLGLGMVLMFQNQIKKSVRDKIFCIVRSGDKKIEYHLWPIVNNQIKAPKDHKVPGGFYVTNNQTTGHCEYPPLLPSFLQTRASAVMLQQGDPNPLPFGAWNAQKEYVVGGLPVLTAALLGNIEKEKFAELLTIRSEDALKAEKGMIGQAGWGRWQWGSIAALALIGIFNAWIGIQGVNTLQYFIMYFGG